MPCAIQYANAISPLAMNAAQRVTSPIMTSTPVAALPPFAHALEAEHRHLGAACQAVGVEARYVGPDPGPIAYLPELPETVGHRGARGGGRGELPQDRRRLAAGEAATPDVGLELRHDALAIGHGRSVRGAGREESAGEHDEAELRHRLDSRPGAARDASGTST